MRSRSTCAAVLVATLLGGCAQTTWTKPGADAGQRDADLADCEAFARAQTEDFVARNEDTRTGIISGTDPSPLQSDFRRYDQRSRRLSLIDSCMRQLGYTETEVPAEDGSTAEGAGDAS